MPGAPRSSKRCGPLAAGGFVPFRLRRRGLADRPRGARDEGPVRHDGSGDEPAGPVRGFLMAAGQIRGNLGRRPPKGTTGGGHPPWAARQQAHGGGVSWRRPHPKAPGRAATPLGGPPPDTAGGSCGQGPPHLGQGAPGGGSVGGGSASGPAGAGAARSGRGDGEVASGAPSRPPGASGSPWAARQLQTGHGAQPGEHVVGDGGCRQPATPGPGTRRTAGATDSRNTGARGVSSRRPPWSALPSTSERPGTRRRGLTAAGSPRAARSPRARGDPLAGPPPPGRSRPHSSTSRPGGNAASSASRSRSTSTGAASPISRYSASLATPVGAAPTYDTLGCGLKPAEYAIGTAARRSARSKARAKSRCEVNRRRPRFA